MTLSKDPNALDADLAAQLPTTGATATEKLYAISIDDGRKAHDEKMAGDAARAAAALAESNRHNLACEANGRAAADASMAHVEAFENDVARQWSPEEKLFIDCIKLGVETRKQSLTTATNRETVMRDVVNDGAWLGYQIYNVIAQEMGTPRRTIPEGL